MSKNLTRVFALGGAVLMALPGLAESKYDPSLQVTAEERYDDAILLRAANNGQGELITKLSTALGVKGKDELWKLNTWYSPDLLIHENSARQSVNLEHRGRLNYERRLSPFTELKSDFRIWRVIDPTSLPRFGIGRTLDPILYGTADLEVRHLFTRRFGLRAGEHFEGVKIYYQPYEVTGNQTAQTGGFFGGTEGTCGAKTVNPGNGQAVTCIQAYQTAPGIVNAPFAEAFYKLSRRGEAGLGTRVQFFNFGGDSGIGVGPYATYRYRITRESHFAVTGGAVFFKDYPATVTTAHGVGPSQPNGSGTLPRLNAELGREGPQLEYGLYAGHDLVGASGFTDALWADYASLFASYRIYYLPLKFFAGTTYYRNGAAPNVGTLPLFRSDNRTSAGYSLEGGVEVKLSRTLLAQGVYDRFAQIGAIYTGAQPNLTRNIVAVRLNWTAF